MYHMNITKHTGMYEYISLYVYMYNMCDLSLSLHESDHPFVHPPIRMTTPVTIDDMLALRCRDP